MTLKKYRFNEAELTNPMNELNNERWIELLEYLKIPKVEYCSGRYGCHCDCALYEKKGQCKNHCEEYIQFNAERQLELLKKIAYLDLSSLGLTLVEYEVDCGSFSEGLAKLALELLKSGQLYYLHIREVLQ